MNYSMSDAMERVVWRDKVFNKRTVAMLEAAERLLGRPFDAIPQGSYHAGTTQSAGTHDGGGAVDIYDRDLDEVAHVLRKVGFAAWHRPELWVNGKKIWSAHVHAIAIGDPELSWGAAAQVADYLADPPLDGLAGNAFDPFWHPDPPIVFDYDAYLEGEDDMPTPAEFREDFLPMIVMGIMRHPIGKDATGQELTVAGALRQASLADNALAEVQAAAADLDSLLEQPTTTRGDLVRVRDRLLKAVKRAREAAVAS